MREIMQAVIGKVTPKHYGWDIAFMPDNEVWVVVFREQNLPEPKVGDIAVVRVPRVMEIKSGGTRH